MQNQIEEIKRHAPLLDRPLSASMGQEVIDYLSRLTPLPATGCVAGQSVMSALLTLYPSKDHRAHVGPIKDVDIFYGAQDRYIENGQFEMLKVDQTGQGVDSRINVGEYKRVFEKKLNIENLHVVGMLNLIEMVPGIDSSENKTLMGDIGRLDTVLSEFDFSLVQVGVDLKTGQMRWMPAFEELVNGAPVQAQDVGLAERTWIRYQRKREQMPWLSWDDAQITSAVQLTQARTYALLSGDERIPKKMVGWEDLSGTQKISPIWGWKESSDQASSLAEIVIMRDAGKFHFTPTDEILFDSFVSIYSPSVDPHSIKINSKDPSNDLNVSKDLLRGLTRNQGSNQPLMSYLAAQGSLLLGASPEEMRLGRRPYLIHDAINWNKLDVVDMLLDKGFSPNDRESELGKTAYLQLSIRSGNFIVGPEKKIMDSILARMREMGADVTLPVGLNSTVLHKMVSHACSISISLIREIAEHTTHRKLRNGFEKLPHEVVTQDELTSIQKRIEECYPNDKNQLEKQKLVHFFTRTPLEEKIQRLSEILLEKCHSGDLVAVRDALTQGAPVNTGNHCSPLFSASFRGHLDIVECLLKAGADHGARAENGKTALMMAAQETRIAVMQALLKSGAFLEIKDESGRTALACAITKGNKESVDFLIDQGASVDMLLNTGERLIENAVLYSDKNSPAIIFSLSNALEDQIGSRATEKILIRCKGIAQKNDLINNVAVIDSLLAKISIDQLLKTDSPKLKLYA